jgi:beta-N-acetylhexosaminidase
MIDGKLMLAFAGTSVPDRVRSLLAEQNVAGFTLFRQDNVEDPPQVRALTAALQDAAKGTLPLLLAVDQEGGQLIGLGDGTTQFAGNMALGAAGDASLAERVGRAIGRELRAVGANVNYAPVCDTATNPDSPSLGIRSFGDDPRRVAELAAALVRGLQSEGVAATLKHFPGGGDARADPHHELPLMDLDRERLEAVELVPFRAGIAAGARLVMIGHYSLPAITGNAELPTSLSPAVLRMVRSDLGFEGVAITDALDMRAVASGPLDVMEDAGPALALADLLLCAGDPGEQARIRSGLAAAISGGLVDQVELAGSIQRIEALRRWVGQFPQPDLAVVGGEEHQALARELADRSVTLVRDDAGIVPVSLGPDARVAAIMPRPRDLTPADTSSAVAPGLAAAIRAHHPGVDEFVTAFPPTGEEIADLKARAVRYQLVVIGTIDAARFTEQAALVSEIVSTGVPTVAIALRTPQDLAAYPRAATYVCTYGILAPSLEAAVSALWGASAFQGRLPVGVRGLYPNCHGLTT